MTKVYSLAVIVALLHLAGNVPASELSASVACSDLEIGDGSNQERLYQCSAGVAGGVPPYTYEWISEDLNSAFSNTAFFSRFCQGSTPVSVGVVVTDDVGSSQFASGGTILVCEEFSFGCPPLDFPCD